MSAVGWLVALVTGAAWVAVFRRHPRFLLALPPSTRTWMLWGTAVFSGFAAGSLADGDWRLALFLVVGNVLLYLSAWVQGRESPGERPPSEGGSGPDLDRARPDYVPSWWPNDPSTRHLAASPWNALGWYVPFGLAAAAFVVWRIIDGDGMTNALGEDWANILTIVSVPSLGFHWYFGVRAVGALRVRREQRRDRR